MTVDAHPADRHPVSADSYNMCPGGRGGNQALASARMGVKTAIVVWSVKTLWDKNF